MIGRYGLQAYTMKIMWTACELWVYTPFACKHVQSKWYWFLRSWRHVGWWNVIDAFCRNSSTFVCCGNETAMVWDIEHFNGFFLFFFKWIRSPSSGYKYILNVDIYIYKTVPGQGRKRYFVRFLPFFMNTLGIECCISRLFTNSLPHPLLQFLRHPPLHSPKSFQLFSTRKTARRIYVRLDASSPL